MTETPSYGAAGVMAAHPAAAHAGRDVLIEGGNAIEAAVAAAAVLSAVLPQSGGPGGDAMALVREAGPRGRTRTLDARGPVGEGVGLRAFRDRRLGAIPLHGPLAILTVPGAVAGWRAALELSAALGGRLPLRRLLEPAITVARDGFAAPDPALRPLPADIAAQPGFAEAFLVEGRLPASGEHRRALLWGDVLAYLAQAGLDDLYRGDIGREVVRELEELGSPLSRDDLRRYEPRWRDPLSLRGSLGLVEAPAGANASRVLASLGLIERLIATHADGAAHVHRRTEAMKQAERLVAQAIEDDRDLGALLEPAVLEAAGLAIDPRRAAPVPIASGREVEQTWIGVIDGSGLAVSLCQSLGMAYGSGCRLVKTGLLMGNRGAAFDLDDDEGRVLRRGRRAPMRGLPMIVAAADGAVTSLGASSWPLAATMLMQRHAGALLGDAVQAPRALPQDALLMVEDGSDPSIVAALDRAGHDIRPASAAACGEAGALTRRPGGRIDAAPDPRRDAVAAGF